MGRDDEAAVLAAFRACFAADLKSGRARAPSFYQRMFPGFDAAVAAAYARLDAEHAAPPAAPPREEPETIGPYRVISELGRGAQGTVFLAEDPRVERRVALKVLAPAYASSPQMLRRFRREANAASKLDHPAICTVYDADVDGRTPWIAMRYVAGRSLAQLIAASRPREPADDSLASRSSIVSLPASSLPGAAPGEAPPAEGRPALARLIRFFEEAAHALHVAHEAGLVHRDVKPGNLMVTEDARPVILDFGLAQEDEEGGRLTETGALMGTPAYMSPEQLLGQRIALDRRTDVYSLGVALYECLALRLPFDAPTRDALYQQILTSEPPKLRRANRTLPRDLEVVVETAMAKDPARRYRTAHDFAEDLRRVREQETIRARPAGPLLRLSRWAQRKPALAASLAAVFLLLAGGLAVTTTLLRRTEDALADAESERARADAALREAMSANAAKDVALRRARALNLVHEAARTRDADPMLSLLLAREAVRTTRIPEAVMQIRDALAHLPQIAEMQGHAFSVTAGAWSPAGDKLLTASGDGTARLWSLAGAQLAQFAGHTDVVSSAAFAPSGTSVVTASFDGTARLWRSDGTPIATLRHGDAVLAAAYSPGGDRIVTAGVDGTARIWDASGAPVATLRHDGPVWSASFSPRGDVVVTASDDGTARLWRSDGRETAVLRGHSASVRSAVFSRDGRLVVTTSRDRTARIWDAAGAPVATLRPLGGGEPLPVFSATFSPSADVVFVSYGPSATIWSADGRLVTTISAPDGDIRAATYSPDGERIATTSEDDRAARLWTRTGRLVASLTGHEAGINGASFSPDGATIATWSHDGTARLWRWPPGFGAAFPAAPHDKGSVESSGGRLFLCNSTDEVVVRTLDGRVRSVLRSPKGCHIPHFVGERIVTVSGPHTTGGWEAIVWDADGREVAKAVTDECTYGADVTEDASRIVAGTLPGHVILFDGSGREVSRFLVPGGVGVNNVRFVPPGGQIVFGATDGTIRVWDVDGTERRVLAGHPADAAHVEVSPQGTHVASWGVEGTVRLWDLATGAQLALLREGEATARFSPGGDRVVVAGDSGARVFDLAGRELMALPHSARVTGAAFADGGNAIVLLSADGVIQVSPASDDEALRLAQVRRLRDFTAAERRRYAEMLDETENGRALALHDRLEDLRRDCVVAADLADAVRRDPRIPDDRRAAALEIAARARDDATGLNNQAWTMVSSPSRSADDYRIAVRRAEACVRAFPFAGFVVNTAGVARYRAGDMEGARRMLRLSDAVQGRRDVGDTAFLAMALCRLGRMEEARIELERSRALVAAGGGAADAEKLGFLREAEALLGGAVSPAK